MRAIKGSLLLLLLVTLVPSAAHAGGWWSSIGLEGQPVGSGESMAIEVSEVMFDSMEEAEKAKGQRFFAYLVREFDQAALDDAMTRPDPGDWWTPRSEPILAGIVELYGWDSNLAKGRAHLDIPELPGGGYFLMLCDKGCEVALGNLVPSKVIVAEDVFAAQTTRRLQEAQADLTLALQRSRSHLRETRSTLREAISADAEQNERLGDLETELAAAQEPQAPPWIVYAGWFFAGTLAALLLLSLRRRAAPPTNSLVDDVPDDARELISSR